MADVTPGIDADSIVDALVDRDRRALARAITAVENRSEAAAGVVAAAYRRAGDVPIIGFTGAGGVGKSTVVDRLTSRYRKESDARVAVVAVDPTSPFTGGALLGDRVRMQRHSEDPRVYVRSMATRGALGGLAAAVYDTLVLLRAAGFDRILVETVGVGQDEVDVAAIADTTCLVLTPSGGDEVQVIKAGVMEVADIFVVNKADLPGVDRAEAQLHAWVTGPAGDGGWSPPIVRTIATEGTGIDELGAAIDAHLAWYRDSRGGEQRRRALARMRLHALLREALVRDARRRGFDAEREDELVEAIARGDLDPYSAARKIVEEVSSP